MISHVEPYYGRKEMRAVNKYLKSGGFMTEHKMTAEFEERLAKFLKVPYVSCVPNGTSALYLSLLAAGVGRGDKVIVPDLTMVATPNAVRMVGAEPVLIDIEVDSYCLNMDLLKANKKIKAIIYVDLNGRSGNMNRLVKFCRDNNIVLIEDACQSFGSKYKDRYLGTFGRFGCFSLGFHKIITTGQGGFIVSHNRRDYETVERLKDFGRVKGGNDIHEFLGFNFKFTDLQAVIGIEQLKTINWRINKKRQLYNWYTGKKAKEGWVPWFIEVWSAFPVRIKNYLLKHGIESRLLYPPIHTQKIYKKANCPMAESVSNTGLWLPSSLKLTKEQVDYIIKIIKEADPNANF